MSRCGPEVEWTLADISTSKPIASGRVAAPVARWVEAEKKAALGVLHALGWDRARLEVSGAWSRIVSLETPNREAIEAYAAALGRAGKR